MEVIVFSSSLLVGEEVMGFDNGGSSLSCVPLETLSVCFLPPLFLLEFNKYINFQK